MRPRNIPAGKAGLIVIAASAAALALSRCKPFAKKVGKKLTEWGEEIQKHATEEEKAPAAAAEETKAEATATAEPAAEAPKAAKATAPKKPTAAKKSETKKPVAPKKTTAPKKPKANGKTP